jgi:hypothetical protein
VMLHRRDHSRRGCCPCRSPSAPIPDHAQSPLASSRHRHAAPVVNAVAGVPVAALTINSVRGLLPPRRAHRSGLGRRASRQHCRAGLFKA